MNFLWTAVVFGHNYAPKANAQRSLGNSRNTDLFPQDTLLMFTYHNWILFKKNRLPEK